MDGIFTAKFDAYRNPGGGKPPPGLDFSRVKTILCIMTAFGGSVTNLLGIENPDFLIKGL